MTTRRKRNNLNEVPIASPVKITRPDGSVTTQRSYTRREAHNLIEAGRKKPRTWNEINSGKGGGHDFKRT